jgi:hypothetical protein
MTIQTVELAGQRFVILPESEFREIERKLASQMEPPTVAGVAASAMTNQRFEAVVPFTVAGEQASEMLIRERR